MLHRLVAEGTVIRADRPSRRYSRTQIEAVAAERTEWISSREVAWVLGVSTTRVAQLARADKIPFETDHADNRKYRHSQIEVVAHARLVRWHHRDLET
jgi:hypothetical protein